MPDPDIDCLIHLAHNDFIMSNHRVHDVSVMPGVTFLDILYRILLARGIDHRHVALRNILFTQPVTTREGLERELRVTLAPAHGDARQVRFDSRWLREDDERTPWRQNARAELVPSDEPEPEPLDIAGLKAGAMRVDDMEVLYELTRRKQIRHGPPMKCFGNLYRGEEYLVAELHLDPSLGHPEGFYLHPAKMDASTLVAFGATGDAADEPFIPFFIEYFRALRPLGERFHVQVPGPEVRSGANDLLRNSYGLYGADGEFIAEFRNIYCKRIRSPELITKLLREADEEPAVCPTSAAALRSGPATPSRGPATALVEHLRERVGTFLGKSPDEVPSDVGFYELGLDSVALLRMGEELQPLVGSALYPTLLFELSTIDSLAEHLASSYPAALEALGRPAALAAPGRPAARGADPVGAAEPQGRSDEALCLRDLWMDAGTSSDLEAVDELIVFGAPQALLDRLRERVRRVVEVTASGPQTRSGPDVSRVDLSDRRQLARLFLSLAQGGSRLPACLHVAVSPTETDDARNLWRLAAALVDGRPTEPVPLVSLTFAPARPGHEALGALAASISAEVPLVRCRVVEVDTSAAAPATADVIMAEVGNGDDERHVRYRSGARRVRRWAAAEPGPQAPPAFRENGVYLITGGGGGIAAALAGHLASRYRARLILVGRRPCDDSLQRRIDAWTTQGGLVRYVQADVAITREVQDVVAQAREQFGGLHGVLHCAGSLRDGLFFGLEEADLPAAWRAKVDGTLCLDEAVRQVQGLDCFVLFSSLAAALPNPGQAAYAFGNSFQYHFARWRSRQPDRPGRTLAVAWPLWADGGMRVPEGIHRRFRAAGLAPMPNPVGLELLERGLAGPHERFAVLYGEPAHLPGVLPSAPPSRLQTPAHAPQSLDAVGAPPIAVIGIAGQYPGAPDLQAFWRNLVDGRDCITEIPPGRWDHDAFFDPDRHAAGRTYSRWGGFLDGVDLFDPSFFAISRREAERMDPQERLFLTTSWQVFEDAGYAPTALHSQTAGVFVGVMWNHYQLFTDPADGVAPTAMHASIANRVSYCLNLRGPSMAVDTACSSSLTAVHLAVESIRRGECTVALAGGVNVSIHPQKYLQLAQGQFLSADGRCRSFGSEGTGYVPGEGVGAVLLKRLDRAQADGDHILAVITATALNHTGHTSGYTVPSPGAQGALIQAALRQAGWDPRTVGYVEAHGTGTSLGDPIEVEALRQAFCDSVPPGENLVPGRCAIGSVKSNIGHLEGAAGIAGLTKVLLQLQHGRLVPSLHSAETNPRIDLASSPFRVQQLAELWRRPDDGRARRAGVSAFGAGGANVHVLVEEAPAPASRAAASGTSWLFVLSARNQAALHAYAERYLAWLAGRGEESAASSDADWLAAAVGQLLGIPAEAVEHTEPLGDLGFGAADYHELARRLDERGLGTGTPLTPDTTVSQLARRVPPSREATADPGDDDRRFLSDLAYTLQVGRAPMAARLAVVATGVRELRQTLERFVAGEPANGNGFWGAESAAPAGSLTPDECIRRFRAGRLTDIAAQWVTGGNVAWAACYNPDAELPRRLSLPTYPFQQESCWIGRWRRDARPAEPAEPPSPPARPGPSSGGEVELREVQPGIALITMRDEAGSNMFTPAMMRGLQDAFDQVGRSPEVKAVVLSGAERVFSMGAPQQALEALARGGSFTDGAFIYEGLLRCGHPVVAAMQGHASGGGLAFGLYADLVVMARESVYTANFMTYGLTPGMGATFILERRFGSAVAAEMFYAGRSFTGEELERRAASVSFAARADVLPTALRLARAVAEMPAQALQTLKQDLAQRMLDRLSPVITRESAMHEHLPGAERIARTREHFGKVTAFRTGAPAPAEPAAAVPPATPPAAAATSPSATAGDRTPHCEPAADSAAVRASIVDALCASLYLRPPEINPALTFSEMGLDSIGAVELARELSQAFGLDINSTAVYDHPTVTRLADAVAELAARGRELYDQATRAAPAEPRANADSVPASPPPSGPAAAAKVRLRPLAPGSSRGEMGAAAADITPAPAGRRSAAQAAPAPRAEPTQEPGPAEIAVIGMAGRFPDAPDLDAFWQNLVTGRNSIREVPGDRWDAAACFDPDRRAPGRTYSKWAALLSDIDAFDPALFLLSPLEAAAMDPQQRVFLQTAWAALEDAGYAVPSESVRRWGVFVGCAAGDYLDLLRQADQNESAHAFLGNSSSVLAARIGYLLNLSGPTVAIDTACSSSLVAVHLACESIRAGECDAAIAGGVALMLTPRMHILTSKAGMLSPTGRCAPFDARADGIVLGEGSGAVMLKRLDRALADGDFVHGTILASGHNGDGRTNGLTAPSASSQAELIARVHQRAGVGPDDIGYVEAHGTGTPLGDPIEVRALEEAFGKGGAHLGRCGIGSVKSNIGHTTMAAGIAGLLKVLLALRHGMLPPTINFESPNPEIDFSRSSLRPVTGLEPWRPGPAGRLMAGVSSFGFSGTNAHVVVAQAPRSRSGGSAAEPAQADTRLLLPVSARTPAALAQTLVRLADHLADGARRPPFARVAYTLAMGRTHFPVRTAVIARGYDELLPLLRAKAGEVVRGPAGQHGPAWPAAPHEGATLEQLAEAYLGGQPVDWAALYRHLPCERTPLPGYPFADERYWVTPTAPPKASAAPGDGQPAASTSPAASCSPAELLFVPALRQLPSLADGAGPRADSSARPSRQQIVVVHEPATADLAQALLARHRADGDEALSVPWPDKPDFRWNGTSPPDTVYFLACAPDVAITDARRITLALFRLVRALLAADRARAPVTLKVAVAGAVPVCDGEVHPAAAALPGLVRSLVAEHGRWTAACVDVGTTQWDPAELAHQLHREPCSAPLILLRDGRRMVRVLRQAPSAPADAAASTFRPGGVYLVLGGSGGIGGVLCRYLARTAQARLAVIGRRPLDAGITALLDEIDRLGGRAVYLQADAADPAALRWAADRARDEFGALHGAFHAAVVLRDRALVGMSEDELCEVLAAKQDGAIAFGEALRHQPLDFMAFFSSAVAFTDAPGQANYAAASTFEDAYAMHLRAHCPFPVSVINWGYWGSVGAVTGRRYADRFHSLGVGSIDPDEGMASLTEVLRGRTPQAAVVKATPATLARLGVEFSQQTDDDLTTVRTAFAELNRLAPALLRRELERQQALPPPGNRITLDQLRARLGVVPAMDRLLRALEDMLISAGALQPHGEELLVTVPGDDPAAGDLTAAHPELAPHVRLMERCTASLCGVLNGTREPTEVLFPGGSTELVEHVYQGQAAANFYHRLMAGQVEETAARAHGELGRRIRILEIGAGTGATSAFVLDACASSVVPAEFCYTDISSAFLRRGEDAFKDRFPFITFQVLDIERDPVAQGFDAHGYDVVFASNVLHATSSVEQTLAHVRQLLRPGGTLLVNEVTRASDFLTVTFGLTPGWWKFRDPEIRLANAPLLGTSQWREVLAAAGFGSVRILGFADTPPDDLEQCVLAAVSQDIPPAVRTVAGAAARGYVRKVFSEVLRIPQEQLSDRLTFDNYGVDSLTSMDIMGRLEQDLGPLPDTLLFEHLTIQQLADHLAAENASALGLVTGATAAVPPGEPASAQGGDPGRSEEHAPPTQVVARPEPGGEDIAVIGAVGRYPGAPDLDAFWQLIAQGRSSVTEIPPDRWDWREHFDAERGRPNRTYSRWGGFIDGIDLFDAGFFGILPRDAENIDPQERLFLEAAWELLEETGYLGEHTHEPETGVFVGTMYGSYGQLGATQWARGTLTGARSLYWSIPNRVSYFLDLQGPSFAVDSACSSSLLAVQLACEAIRRGECRMAIAGGVNVIVHPAHLTSLCSLNMLSADGLCKVFDERADGFVPGEGIGAVLLKPLDRAVADGDDIWGIIKGGLANAGGKTSGYTVPNPRAQVRLIAEAMRRSGVDPSTIGYVEAHGTGTELGDPIEVAALTEALGRSGQAEGGRCAIGSVKANIGHLEGAAGIAGLTRVLLQLRHAQLAPCANLDAVNPKIRLDRSQCFFPRSLSPWPRLVTGQEDGERPVPRRAGISSFGAGGANVHLVVEEYAAPPSTTPDIPPGTDQVFILSARTGDQLAAFADRVAQFLARLAPGGATLAGLCYSSQVGRREMPERLAVIADDLAVLERRLRAFTHGTAEEGVVVGTAARSLPEDDDPATIRALLQDRRLADAARMWVRGAPVDWRPLWSPTVPRRVAFPTYPFDRKRYWLRTGADEVTVSRVNPAPPEAGITPAQSAPAGTVCRFQRPAWARRSAGGGARRPRVVLVMTGDTALGDGLERALASRGIRCVVARPGGQFADDGAGRYSFVPSADAHYTRLADSLAHLGLLPDAVVHALATEVAGRSSERLAAELETGLYSFFHLTVAILKQRQDAPLHALFSHCSLPGNAGPGNTRSGSTPPAYAAVAGAIRALAMEHDRFCGARIEFEASVPTDDQVACLLGELYAARDGEVEVRYRQGQRWVKFLEEFVPPAATDIVRPGGTYLITGGAGALGLRFAETLIRDGAGAVALAGRSELELQIAERIAGLSRGGASVTYHRADIGQEQDTQNLISAITGRHGALHGVIHAAGVTRDRRALQKTVADFAAVLAPKAFGATFLDEATKDQPLDFFALFSSVAAETGNLGQADYAAANAFLNAFAERRETLRHRGERSGRTLAAGWPLWADGGITVDAATRELFARKWSMVPMRTTTGIDAFRRGLASAEPCFLVVEGPRAVAVEVPGADVVEVPRADVVAGPGTGPGADGVAQAQAACGRPLTADRLREMAERDLRRMASTFLLVGEEEIDLSDDLMETGFDSISLTELINRVNETYGLDLLPAVLFECSNLSSFADYLVRHHSVELAGLARALSPPDAAAPAPPGARAVAVVGMAATLPGSPDPEAFWRHLAAGDDLIRPAPKDRLELHSHPGTAGVRAGFIDDVAGFDAELFGISPAEATLMDPQHRLFLQACWRAIEDAGYSPDALAGTDTALFVAVSTTDYADLLRARGVPAEAHAASGIAHSMLANRVSHLLDLHGPSEAVDTACSGSLVAIHRAVRAITSGDCSAAIAGGVNVLLSPGLFIAFTQSGMLSPDAACRAFDKGANGYVRAEGVAAVVLKPLQAAERDGDHIYAVIRGSAVNHAGRSPSLTAPNPDAQAQVLVAACREAGIDPTTITAIEAHGTGTQLGDQVEIEGMKKAFAQLYADSSLPFPDRKHVAVGSVKTNIGHLEAAAGIAGVVKMLLAMKHGVLPPTIHFTELNPSLRLDATPLFINDRALPWGGVLDGTGRTVRRAGVSSFGFGGTNAHIVLESWPDPDPADLHAGRQLVVLSAPQEEALRHYARHLEGFLAAHPGVDLTRVAYTLQTGRRPMRHRLALIAADPAEAIRALGAAAADGEMPGLYRGTAGQADEPVPSGAPLELVAARWVDGAAVRWEDLWKDGAPRRIPVPGLPLSRRPHWFDDRAERTEMQILAPPTGPLPDGKPRRGAPRVTLAPAVRATAGGEHDGAPLGDAEPPARPAARPPRPPGQPTPQANGHPVDIGRVIRGHVAEILDLDPGDLPADRPFAELGLDSIFRLDLARRLNREFSLELEAPELYDHDCVEALAGHVARAVSGRAVPDRGVPGDGAAYQATEAMLEGLIRRVVGRPLDPGRSFAANGFTSFDMLRVVSALESQFGALRKTLLFDAPTVRDLAAYLTDAHGHRAVAQRLALIAPGNIAPGNIALDNGARPPGIDVDAVPPASDTPPPGNIGPSPGPVVVRRGELDAFPELAAILADIDARYAGEGGPALGLVAPIAFVGTARKGYLNFSRRKENILAWTYAGPEEAFPEVLNEWLDYARAHGLRPSLMSLKRIDEVAGIALTATPFGALQRLENLGTFTLSGGKMRRLRYMVQRFERSGRCQVAEYQPGTEKATDAQISEMIARWGENKNMVNPYVAVVREELGAGRLAAHHRMFLTRVDDRLVNVVVVTKIPSQNGYLLALEFYPDDMPLGGLEYAITEILRTLDREGHTLFSFGYSFGVKVCDSASAAPDIEQGLAELRSAGILDDGNFQFKNKFRPGVRPVYLCQRADEQRTSVADVILMIADPDLRADAPGMIRAVAGLEPGRSRTASDDGGSARHRQLAASGYNPLSLSHADVELDLLTDSWAELSGSAIAARERALRDRAEREPDPAELPPPPWLPFEHVMTTASGRSAEAALCRAWPGLRGQVIHNGIFPTWASAFADFGFTEVRTPAAAATGQFRGDLDLEALQGLLGSGNGAVSFVCVELNGNAGGGYPVSFTNLRGVHEAASAYDVPLVFDATRILENAFFIVRHEDGFGAAEVWDVVRDMLALADAASFSLSKDFGVSFGGLVAARSPVLAGRLREHVALRGREVGLAARKMLGAALADTAAVADQVSARMAAVQALWTGLTEAAVPALAPAGGHCVVLDVEAIPALEPMSHPVASCLAWLYQGTGVRGGPHLDRDHRGDRIRLAVPVGTELRRAREAAHRIAELWRNPGDVPDLLPLSDAAPPAAARYQPRGEPPADARPAAGNRVRAADQNACLLREQAPAVERHILRLPDGNAEVFVAGKGPPLVLMHPFNIGAGVFFRQFAELAARYRLVTMHHPGVGLTTARSDLSLDGIGRLYHAVLGRLGVSGPVHVAGTSFGGLVALGYALRYAGETASLVLIGSSYKVDNRNGEVDKLAVVAKEDFDRVADKDGSPRMRQARAELEALLLRCESMDPQIGLSYLDVFATRPSLLGRLPEVAVPTLVMQGRHDTVIPVKTAHLLHGSIPDSEYVELVHAGHFPYLTHPDEVHRALLPFLAARRAPVSSRAAVPDDRQDGRCP